MFTLQIAKFIILLVRADAVLCAHAVCLQKFGMLIMLLKYTCSTVSTVQ